MLPSRRPLVPLAALALAATAACAYVSPPTVHVPGRVVEPEMGRTPTSPSPRPSASPGRMGERRACRASPRPAGWIAVAYVPAPTECPLSAGADSAATGAILVQYSGQPIGTELEVCADQPMPRGWSAGRPEPDAAQRCPGAGRGQASAIQRIRRTH